MNGDLDFETLSSYTGTVIATDPYNSYGHEFAVTITFNNVNDAPTFTAEGATAGRVTEITAAQTDRDHYNYRARNRRSFPNLRGVRRDDDPDATP